VIGKMVDTTPGRVEWLDLADLALMNVTVYDGDLTVAVREIEHPMVAKPALMPLLPPDSSKQVAFGAGANDRRA
jgi:hypothetical protein